MCCSGVLCRASSHPHCPPSAGVTETFTGALEVLRSGLASLQDPLYALSTLGKALALTGLQRAGSTLEPACQVLQ